MDEDDPELDARINRIRERIACYLTWVRSRGGKTSFIKPPASERDVERFEAASGVALPVEYRRFMTEVGDGGWGVIGVTHLDENDTCNASKPFPFTGDHEHDQPIAEALKQLDQDAQAPGTLPVDRVSCGGEMEVLVLNGPWAGTVWYTGYDLEKVMPVDRSQIDGSLSDDKRPLSFLGWYEAKLNSITSQLPMG